MLSSSLCFSDEWSLSKEQVEKLLTLKTTTKVKTFLEQEFMIHFDFIEGKERFENNHMKNILTEYYTSVFKFAISEPLNYHLKTPKKMATILALAKYILIHSMVNELSVDESFQHFGEVLVQHSVRRPPWRFEIFNLDDVKEITSFFHKTFYRHFKLYQYSFTREDFCDFKAPTVDEVKLVLPFIPKNLRDMEETVDLAKEEEEEIEGEKEEEPVREKKKIEKPKTPGLEKVSSREPVSEEVEEEEIKKEDQPDAPKLNRYVVEQLNEVKELLLKFQGEKLIGIDEKLEDLEKRVSQMHQTKTSTPKGKRK